MVGGIDICYDFDWFNGIFDGCFCGNSECGNYWDFYVFVCGWCFFGDVLYFIYIYLCWSVSYNSFYYRKCCVDGFNCSVIFYRFVFLLVIFLNEFNL